MKIHEYQAKEILRQFGVVTPRGFACFSVDEAVAAAEKLGGKVWVVKAQIHAGGRGKGGGVKLARSLDDVRQYAGQILGMMLKTHQTGPEGQKVRRLLIEEGADIKKELYVGMVVDRGTQRVCLMASSEGGMDIEEVAAHTPEKIHKVFVDPGTGLKDEESDDVARKIGLPEGSLAKARVALKGLYNAFDQDDASLAEINPLILTGSGDVIALDAKFNFDDNALFRHPDIFAMRDLDEEDPYEIQASKFDLNYISLDGNIGCLVNGAGLAMATMDITKLYGGSPANFLDVGGSATAAKVTEAFKIMLSNPKVKAILVNIFGGIMKCDVIAEGIVTAARQVNLTVPLVVRLEGTNVDLGKKILADSGLPIISGSNMADAAAKVVKAALAVTAGKAKAPAKAKPKAAPAKAKKSAATAKPKAKSKAKPKPKVKAKLAKKATGKKVKSKAKAKAKAKPKAAAKKSTARKPAAKKGKAAKKRAAAVRKAAARGKRK
jgi:succinyl-CoA synthetase beta subunit